MSTLAENVAKVTAAHAALKTAIAEKGVAVPDGTKLSDMPALVRQIQNPPTFASKFVQFAVVVDGTLDCTQPFIQSCGQLLKYENMFLGCTASHVILPPDLPRDLSASAAGMFSGCNNLLDLSFPVGFGAQITSVRNMFNYCSKMVDLHLPDGFGSSATDAMYAFNNCDALANITGNPNFKASFSLSGSTKLTHDSLMVVINGLQTVTTAQTLTLGAANLAKLTDAEKKVATDKGWTLA